MKKLMIAVIMAMMAISCMKEESPVSVPVTMSVTGTGMFEVGYYDHTWNKLHANDSWSMTVYAFPGDTVRLAAYGNDYPVEMHLDTIGVVIMPHGYMEMKFIVR